MIGVGSLGCALLGYSGFQELGLNIVAAFDAAPDKVGTTVHGKEVLPMDTLVDLTRRMHMNIGILAVPAPVAQSVADMLTGAGMLAIWNFTPVKLTVPAPVVVEDVRMVASFAVLAKRLNDVLKRR